MRSHVGRHAALTALNRLEVVADPDTVRRLRLWPRGVRRGSSQNNASSQKRSDRSVAFTGFRRQ